MKFNMKESYDETKDVFDLLDKAEAKLYDVTQGNIKKSSETAQSLVIQAKKKIEAMAKALLEFETIDSDQINDIMAGKKMRPPKPSRGSDTPKKPSGGNSGTSTVSPQPTAKS